MTDDRTRMNVRAAALERNARWGVGTILLMALAIGVAGGMFLFAGCVPIEAVEQTKEEHAINTGHALDASLPIEARQIAADTVRADAAHYKALTGDELPSDVGTFSPVCPTCRRPAAAGPFPPELAPVPR